MNSTKEILPLEELAPIIAEVVSGGGTFTIYPGGTSMLPTIRPGEDAVVLTAPTRLKARDIILYRRDSGVFVLHRIVKVKKDGSFVLRGDNQFYNESGVLPSHVIAVVERYRKGEKDFVRDCPAEKRLFRRLKARFAMRRFYSGIRHRIKRLAGGNTKK